MVSDGELMVNYGKWWRDDGIFSKMIKIEIFINKVTDINKSK